jgi:hypothetical protein
VRLSVAFLLWCLPLLASWASPAVAAGQAPPKPLVVDMMPRAFSWEANQDREPFLAVDRSDPRRMVASALTPNIVDSAVAACPVYVSLDSGRTWSLYLVVPSNDAVTGTRDITVAISGSPPALYAGIINSTGYYQLETLRGDSFPNTSVMMPLREHTDDGVDQPFLQFASAGQGSLLLLGMNSIDGDQVGGRTAQLDVSRDSGKTFLPRITLDRRAVNPQDSPAIRVAVSSDGVAYVAYEGLRRRAGDMFLGDVVVARDTGGPKSDYSFSEILDPVDLLPGVVVGRDRPLSINGKNVHGQRSPWGLSIAVSPQDGRKAYLAWQEYSADRSAYEVMLARSDDGGQNWSIIAHPIAEAINVTLAVAHNGTLGVLYQQFRETADIKGWHTVLEQTKDDFETSFSMVLAISPSPGVDQDQFALGDYAAMLAVDDEFRGVFASGNFPDKRNFPQDVSFLRTVDWSSKKLLDAGGRQVSASIDPFFFAVPAGAP